MIGETNLALGHGQQFPFHRLSIDASYRRELYKPSIINDNNFQNEGTPKRHTAEIGEGIAIPEGSQLRNDVSKTGFKDDYPVCWIAERRHAPGPTGRVKVQNSSNLTGTASLPERTFPASSVV